LAETAQSPQQQPYFGDRLSVLLSGVAAGGTNWGLDDWFNAALFTSRRHPSDIDTEAFTRFQVALFEATGIRAEVVGVEFGCTRIKVKFTTTRKVTRVSDGVIEEVTHSADVESNDPQANIQHLIPVVIEAIRNHPAISAPLLESGITNLRSETDLDVGSGEVRSGIKPQILVNAQKVVINSGDRTDVYGNPAVVSGRTEIQNLNPPIGVNPPSSGYSPGNPRRKKSRVGDRSDTSPSDDRPSS
jgi:hypothetical protein